MLIEVHSYCRVEAGDGDCRMRGRRLLSTTMRAHRRSILVKLGRRHDGEGIFVNLYDHAHAYSFTFASSGAPLIARRPDSLHFEAKQSLVHFVHTRFVQGSWYTISIQGGGNRASKEARRAREGRKRAKGEWKDQASIASFSSKASLSLCALSGPCRKEERGREVGKRT